MFRIGKNFHVIHMTDDLQALDAFYDDVFSAHRFMPPSYMEAEKRDASLVLIGDFCIEPLAPSFWVDGWADMPLGRFYNRWGRRWHSIAWYVDEGMTELYRALRDAGVRLYGTGGRPQSGDEPTGALFTHPLETGTQLEFVARRPKASGRVDPKAYVSTPRLADPRFEPGFDPGFWSDRHPLGIQKASHVTLAVRDRAAYRDVYRKVLGGRLLHEGPVGLTKTASEFVAVGEDLVVELASPVDPESIVAEDLARHHGGLFAVTFKVKDLAAARQHLVAKGVGVALEDEATLLTDPSTTHGVVLGFTTWSIPGDTRPDVGSAG